MENVRLVQASDGSQSISGVVHNSGERARSVQLEFALYDDQNMRIGQVMVPVGRVSSGNTKGFDWSLDGVAVRVSVRRIVAF